MQELQTSVEDGDPDEAQVFLSGYIENLCPNTVNVVVSITSQKDDGTTIATHDFTVSGVPAGGQSFDLTGVIPYDSGVAAYASSILKVTDAFDMAPHGRIARRGPGGPIAQGQGQAVFQP